MSVSLSAAITPARSTKAAAAQARSGTRLGSWPRAAHTSRASVSPASVSAIAFYLLYRYVPHGEVRRSHAAVGALLACLLFEVAKELFAVYVANVPGYNVLYGAFVAIPFFLIWIYLSWVVVLLGAELTAALGSWRGKARDRRGLP